jgi:histidine triad (HIT) family protein
MTTIFSKIIAGEVPADLIYQDELVTAFLDINPQAPVHLLIVPNQEIQSTNEVSSDDEQMLGHMFVVAKQIAADQGISASGYRLIVNCGADANQEVMHLHMHIVGGRDLGPMLPGHD